jgi:hypothetical protein
MLILETSARSGVGMMDWISYLESRRQEKPIAAHAAHAPAASPAEASTCP